MFEIYAKRASPVPEQNENVVDENQEARERAAIKYEHRDGAWKLFSRICSTTSVFCYQAAIFYAQLILAQYLITCDARGACIMNPVFGNRTTLLVMETACFYLYVLAIVSTLHIARSMARAVRLVKKSQTCTRG